jgi:hypothetical protein
MNEKDKITRLNEALREHEAATIRTGDLKFASEDGSNQEESAPSSESSKMTRQAQQASRSTSSKALFNQRKSSHSGAFRAPAPHKAPTKVGPLKPVGFMPQLRPK